jgi:hypothetical protein
MGLLSTASRWRSLDVFLARNLVDGQHYSPVLDDQPREVAMEENRPGRAEQGELLREADRRGITVRELVGLPPEDRSS